MISVGAMAAAVENHGAYLPLTPSLNLFQLTNCSILIILALEQQHRYLDLRQVLFNIPRTKVRVEPNLVPTPKCSVNILSVIALESLPERALLIVLLDRPDACQPKVLNKNVRRFENQATHAFSYAAARVKQGNGTPVAVPKENRILDLPSTAY